MEHRRGGGGGGGGGTCDLESGRREGGREKVRIVFPLSK